MPSWASVVHAHVCIPTHMMCAYTTYIHHTYILHAYMQEFLIVLDFFTSTCADILHTQCAPPPSPSL